MAEYIDRNLLLNSKQWDALQIYDKARAKAIILGQPTVDVVEVRHAKWCLIEYEYFVCSRCGHWHYTGCESTAEAKERLLNGAVPNYCSNCGAKMDFK